MKTESIEKKESAPREKTRKGMCTLCTRESQCTFPSQPQLHDCDEFEGLSRSPVGVIESYLSHQARNRKSSAGTDDSLKGLCRNCDRREGCAFGKSDGGVWHCEEYL